MSEEDRVQGEIITLIRWIAPSVVAFAIPNASRRTKGARASNAVPGLRKGVFDIGMILPRDCAFPSQTAYCEVKTAKGRLSIEQEEFAAVLRGRFVPHLVARAPNHLDAVRNAFAMWGVRTKEHRGAEIVLFGERAEAR